VTAGSINTKGYSILESVNNSRCSDIEWYASGLWWKYHY